MADAVPDINAETYPFAVVERLLDQAAFFNMYSTTARCTPILDAAGGTRGFRLTEELRRFCIQTQDPTETRALSVSNVLGETVATFEHRWLLAPETFVARPGVEPPTCRFDPSRSQRFVILDSRYSLDSGPDSFVGFGTGRTLPADGGRRVIADAVGTIVEGSGRFRGCDGTYTYCGTLSDRGYRGSVLLRVTDPLAAFGTDCPLGSPCCDEVPEPDTTYVILAGHKKGSESRTSYIIENGAVVGLNVEQQLHLFSIDCGRDADGDVRCTRELGAVVGTMRAAIRFNLLNPGAPGTPDAPIPFKSLNRYEIASADGRTLGAFDGDGFEGRTFNLTLPAAPGQRALRFGGFGTLLNGRGPFAGIRGQLTDNSVVGVAPHALATAYIFRIVDPAGAFRSSPC